MYNAEPKKVLFVSRKYGYYLLSTTTCTRCLQYMHTTHKVGGDPSKHDSRFDICDVCFVRFEVEMEPGVDGRKGKL